MVTGVTSKRFEVYLVALDPAVGSEIQKTRPCVVISPDEMNDALMTIIIAPLTSTHKAWPSRINVTFQRRKGQVVLDQLRTIDKRRLVKKLGTISPAAAQEITATLLEMFA